LIGTGRGAGALALSFFTTAGTLVSSGPGALVVLDDFERGGGGGGGGAAAAVVEEEEEEPSFFLAGAASGTAFLPLTFAASVFTLTLTLDVLSFLLLSDEVFPDLDEVLADAEEEELLLVAALAAELLLEELGGVLERLGASSMGSSRTGVASPRSMDWWAASDSSPFFFFFTFLDLLLLLLLLVPEEEEGWWNEGAPRSPSRPLRLLPWGE
jgi:hypothetical protein